MPSSSSSPSSAVTTLIFDVDDTLYDVSLGFTEHRNGEIVQQYMVDHLKVSPWFIYCLESVIGRFLSFAFRTPFSFLPVRVDAQHNPHFYVYFYSTTQFPSLVAAKEGT